jgi:hypothetical protein
VNVSGAGAGGPSEIADENPEDLVNGKAVLNEPASLPSSGVPSAETPSIPARVATSITVPVQNGAVQNGASVTNVSMKASKIPVGAKMSWAQIAR